MLKSVDRIKNFFSIHPALFISFCYFYLTCVGIVYSYALLIPFGLNIFDFFELSDFLSIALKSPESFYCMLIASGFLGLTYLIYKLPFYRNFYLNTIKRAPAALLFRSGYGFWLLLIFLSPFVMASGSAKAQAVLLKKGKTPTLFTGARLEQWLSKHVLGRHPVEPPPIRIQLKAVESNKQAGWRNRDLRLITSTNRYFFIYNKDADSTYVVSGSNIIHIEYP